MILLTIFLSLDMMNMVRLSTRIHLKFRPMSYCETEIYIGSLASGNLAYFNNVFSNPFILSVID